MRNKKDIEYIKYGDKINTINNVFNHSIVYTVSIGGPLNMVLSEEADSPKSAVYTVYETLESMSHPLDILSNVVFTVTDINSFQGFYRVNNSEGQISVYDFTP